MICDEGNNACIIGIILSSLSGLLLLFSGYQAYFYLKFPKCSNMNLKVILIFTTLTSGTMSIQYIIGPMVPFIFILGSFFLNMYFCSIAIFYVSEASRHLEGSIHLIKIAKNTLYIMLIMLILVFSYTMIAIWLNFYKFDECSSPEYAIAKFLTFLIGCIFFAVSIQITVVLKEKKKEGLQILDSRVKELWYFILRVLVILVFLSVFINFFSYLMPMIFLNGDCRAVYENQNILIVLAISVERCFTHFLPLTFGIFVFWFSRNDAETITRVRKI